MKPTHTASYKALEAASNWFVVLSDKPVSEADYSAWQTWLSENAEHRDAWQKIETVGGMFSSFQNSESKKSARYVLEGQYTNNLNRRQFMKGAMAFTGVAAASWLGWEHSNLPVLASAWNADFRTHVGQVSSYDLDDGSKVWLNTNSAMNHHFDSQFRHVSLVTGEAFIETDSTHDARPFIASCDHAVINAGKGAARFCVRHVSNLETVLAVYDGKVSLAPLNGDLIQNVQAGQEVTFTAHTIIARDAVEAMYESWVNGVLIVDGMPLSEFLNEIGRYRYGYINIDPSVANLKVTGTYPVHNFDLVINMLESSFPIHVKQSLPWWTSVSSA